MNFKEITKNNIFEIELEVYWNDDFDECHESVCVELEDSLENREIIEKLLNFEVTDETTMEDIKNHVEYVKETLELYDNITDTGDYYIRCYKDGKIYEVTK